MKISYKKIVIFVVSFFAGLYLLFLALPFIVSPVAAKYTSDIENIIKNSTGLITKIDGLGVTVSPKFAIGLKADNITIALPDSKEPFFAAQKAGGNLKLLSLLKKQIEFGKIYADDLNTDLVVNDNGNFEIADFFEENNSNSNKEQNSLSALPFDLKLSDKLPDIIIKRYKFAINKNYYIKGENFRVSDFILNKKVKLSTNGKIVLDSRIVSVYDLKIYNKIMPDWKLNDLIFPSEETNQKQPEIKSEKEHPSVSVAEIFKLINKNQLAADLSADIKVSGTFTEPVQNGYLSIENISAAVDDKILPKSYAKLIFKGDKTDVDSVFFTSPDDKNEKTQIIGNITSGKKPSIDLTLRSNAKFNNVIKLVNSFAKSFNMNDFETLSATGSIDADFNINSDLKKVLSTGYLKVLPSSFKYGLYNVAIDNITADVDLMNNHINIKDSGFTILGHNLKLNGSITPDAVADLKLTGSNLSVKSLLIALGQASLLKENQINSGIISIAAFVKGKLSEIKPDITLNISNLQIYNKPLAVKLAIPQAKILADMESINIQNSYALIENFQIDVTGKIKEYLHNKLDLALVAKVNKNQNINISGTVTNLLNPKLNLTVEIPQNISIPVPYMGNSNMTGNGNIAITGTPEKPKLKGQVKLKDISVRDLNFYLTDTIVNFDGSGISGNATAAGLKFDNITGSDINTKFTLENFNLFSLKNITSTFWNGKITGSVLYNIATTGVKVDVQGKGLNSTDAVFATTAIPKALTGLLDFSAKLTTSGLTDIDMIKNLKGDVDFVVKDGRFLSIGRLENIVQAQNITSVSLLKSAISALSTAATVVQTDKFDSITGDLSLNKGQANISHIKVIGPLMSYHVKGIYNILPNTAYLVILGRLDAKTVALLGPLGQLSADKLLSYIPKFGTATAKYLKLLTADPANEDTSLIPDLSTGSKDFKDFKVIFNGPVDKSSSMKNFKWLSVCDTAKIDVKEDLKNASQAVKDNVNSQVNSAKNTVQAVKTNVTNTVNTTTQKAKNEVDSAKQTIEDVKNIDTKQTVKNLGNLLKNAAANANKQVETPKEEAEEKTEE